MCRNAAVRVRLIVAANLNQTARLRCCSRTLLGSRGQLCLNSQIKQLTGVLQNMMCQKLVEDAGCQFWKSSDRSSGRAKLLQNVADIEDLVQVGMSKRVRFSLLYGLRATPCLRCCV